ncbi:MAG TPA: 4Fe-4S dicluster domain-containing protein [Euryarchaeota archaeon]|nr:4Fe-4S dicluster domain-containing protein [Euryarchaeota archaeon]HIQ10001.1 4Fe-4S dicluster domain-containing protein [Euryarchaeota archaeon]
MGGKEVPAWLPSKCIRCGLCVGVCPVGAVVLTDGCVRVDPDLCTGCGACIKGCPVAALLLPGGGVREE